MNRLVTYVLALVTATTMMTACTPPPRLTRDEQIQLTKNNAAAGENVYKNIPVSKIADAAVNVLTLMDPPDMSFSHFDNRVVATRFYTAYMVFSTVAGFDIWAVYFKTLPDNTVHVTVRVSGVQNFGMFSSIPPVPPIPPTPAEYTALSEAESKLFFRRLDYMLGLTTEWIPCDKAREFAKTNGYKVHNDFGPFPRICGDNWFGIEDKKPNQ